MQLTDITFIFYFLPLFLAVYYITSEKQKQLTIIAGSLIFYALQDGVGPWQLALLLGLIGFTFLMGAGAGKHKGVLEAGLAVLAAVLILFKCWSGGTMMIPGISFFLFQMAAYLWDVGRHRMEPERDLTAYSAQILLFPKLLSGPLMEPAQLKMQMARPKISRIRFRAGLQEMVLGLSLKVLLADRLAGLWNQIAVIGYDSISAPLAWLALAAYALRLYLDFHGYSLMAVGLGKMLGFQLPGNFDDPYAARSISDFYNRWHMTLYRWFREYIYIPLGGSRKGKLRTVLNILIVWTFTGLWHGIGGNYLIWALFLAFWIIQEKLWLGRLLKKSHFLAHVYTLFLILLSWVPFAIGDGGQMLTFFSRLFSADQIGTGDVMTVAGGYLPILLAAVVIATPLPGVLFEVARESILCDCILFVLFWLCIYFVSTASQDPFLYFSF